MKVQIIDNKIVTIGEGVLDNELNEVFYIDEELLPKTEEGELDYEKIFQLEVIPGFTIDGTVTGFTLTIPKNNGQPDLTSDFDKKKFKINNSFDDPSTIDYDILGLNKKRTFINGELREVGYYRNYDYTAKTYSDLVILESRTYNRDAIGLVVSRDLTSTWYLNDGSIGLTKGYKKYYTPEEAIQEGIDRRSNCITFAKITLLNELAKLYGEPINQQYSFDLLTSVKTEMEYYSQGYKQPLINAVSASTKPYLTENIKIKIIEQLTF